ncbi:MAG: MFS transporter [Desulfomicrobium escambiense]|nr:MFS transporter [Desulfomicrobium escambiense]
MAGGICASRVFNGLVFMSYAAALSVLQREWGCRPRRRASSPADSRSAMPSPWWSAPALPDRISPKRLYLWSLFAAGVFSLIFAVFARGFASALILHTIVGISLGGTYTTGVMIIADQYAARHRGMAVGFFIASTSCGYAFSLAHQRGGHSRRRLQALVSSDLPRAHAGMVSGLGHPPAHRRAGAPAAARSSASRGRSWATGPPCS